MIPGCGGARGGCVTPTSDFGRKRHGMQTVTVLTTNWRIRVPERIAFDLTILFCDHPDFVLVDDKLAPVSLFS